MMAVEPSWDRSDRGMFRACPCSARPTSRPAPAEPAPSTEPPFLLAEAADEQANGGLLDFGAEGREPWDCAGTRWTNASCTGSSACGNTGCSTRRAGGCATNRECASASGWWAIGCARAHTGAWKPTMRGACRARRWTWSYAGREKVVLVCDNLNTHTLGAFYAVFEPPRARALPSAWRPVPSPRTNSARERGWQVKRGIAKGVSGAKRICRPKPTRVVLLCGDLERHVHVCYVRVEVSV